jgi:gas vesicle protein
LYREYHRASGFEQVLTFDRETPDPHGCLHMQRQGGLEKMKRIIIGILSGALLTGAATMSFADEKIKDRKQNQQKRIAQGVKSGELTPHETARIEHNESKINREVRQDRKANGGNLTNKEKAQVNRQQNRVSKEIYNQKHDGQTQ